MSLAELQHNFRDWLVAPTSELAQHLAAPDSPGLPVYQNNYRAQLVGSLEASFPQVRAWMGVDAFHYAAVSHIDRHPPHAWTLDAYPDEFGATLAELFPYNPDIHELAWIEAALNAAFVAQDAEPLTPADLANIDWERARLQLAPSLRTHVASANAETIWWAMSGGQQRPEGEMLAAPQGLLVWRRGLVSCLRSVDLLELEALRHLQTQGSFAALCALLVERLGEDEGIAKAGVMLASWLGSEMITGAGAHDLP